jgi:hypothetical protein
MTKDIQALVLLAMACTIVAGLTVWRMGLLPRPEERLVFEPEIASQAEAPAAQSEERKEYPLATAPAAPALGPAALRRAFSELLGAEAVASFLELDDFPRRFVATVDNLARPHAPALAWPVHRTPERFSVQERDGESFIAIDNASRYTPFVLVAQTVDTRRAVDLYVRLYPWLQNAYEELGFPRHRFNDRVMAVIDVLLATPQAEEAPKLRLTQVKGPIASLRPWVRYEFDDPALESLSAGQKILLRVGPANQRRLKDKLLEVRDELARRSLKR